MRPEAWILSGSTSFGDWPPLAEAGLRGADGRAPVLWAAPDFVVTGDPMFSLTDTAAWPRSSGAKRGLADVPNVTVAAS